VGYPSAVAVTPNGAYVYVTSTSHTNGAPSQVSVISTATNTVTATLPVGVNSYGLAITPNGQYAYVTNAGYHPMIDGSVSVISTATNTLITTIPVGNYPNNVGITPNGQYAYVTNGVNNSVSVISTATNTLTAMVNGLSNSADVAIAPNGASAYVTNEGSNSVSVISTSTNTVTATLPVGNTPSSVDVTPNGQYAYVTNSGSDSVSVINLVPAVSVSPSSWTMDVGQSKTFTAATSGGSGTYKSYQWYVGGIAQAGQTASTFSFIPASASFYSITATVTDSNSLTSVQSTAAAVTVVAPTLPFTDNFANLNAWTIVDGTWTLRNGGVQGTSSTEAVIFAGSSSWANYQITAVVTLPAGQFAGIVFRYSNSNNYYWAGIGDWGNQYGISKVVGGVNSEIIGSGTASSNGAGTYTLKVVTQGSTITLYVNSILVLTTTDTTFASGAIGLRTYNTTIEVESISASTPAPTPTPSPTPTSSPTPTPSPTPRPTQTPTPTPSPSPTATSLTTTGCQIGTPYQGSDNLTVTLTSFTMEQTPGSYQYTITYTLVNNNPNTKIDEGAFKMYYQNGSEGLPQYGFFGFLFYNQPITRTYTFEELTTKPFNKLAYGPNLFFTTQPPSDALVWNFQIPGVTPIPTASPTSTSNPTQSPTSIPLPTATPALTHSTTPTSTPISTPTTSPTPTSQSTTPEATVSLSLVLDVIAVLGVVVSVAIAVVTFTRRKTRQIF